MFANRTEGQWHASWHRGNADSRRIEVFTPSGETWSFDVQRATSMSPEFQAHWPAIEAWEGNELQRQGMRIYAVAHAGKLRGFVTDCRHLLPTVCRFGTPPLHSAVTDRSTCEASPAEQMPSALPTTLPDAVVQRRVLRLALACTGEYAAFHGGTVEGALAAMVEAVNRANAVFGPEVGVQFELVADNGDLVFIDPQTDPFSNVNAVQMLGQNQSLLTAVLGPDGYDIGHVFGTGTSSIAALASACGTSKARGVSRSNTPTGEAFEVGQFCHELGHQLGANHTHSSSTCNVHAATAFEPGSGSTIMGYAGLCAPNLQPVPDDEFHGHALHEIKSFFSDPASNGAQCPSPEGNPNHPPAITLPSGALPVPPATPFTLEASGFIDFDFDDLTFSWEQRNAGQARFRSFPPSASPIRTFPADAGTGGLGDDLAESLPEAGESLTFLCSARDNLPTRGGVGLDTTEVYVPENGEPFGNVSWSWSPGADSTLLLWNPGTTNGPPFNDSLLQAWLSNDEGLTYSIPLASGIPNTGTACIPWPAALHGPSYRLRLSPMNGIYFAVSQNELDASANPAGPPDGIDLSVVAIQGLAGDSLCGYAVAPRAVVHNFGSIPANGFQLLFEDLATGDTFVHNCQEMLEPGQSIETGPAYVPDEWWVIGYGHHEINIQVSPFANDPVDINPTNNNLQTSIFTHCTANCPGCGCTSPASCNFNDNAIFPDEASCQMPGPDECPCESSLAATATLSGGESHSETYDDIEGTPDVMLVSVAFDNGGSVGSFVADLALSLCAPSGNCITVGGYNATLPGVNVGPWPNNWMSLSSGAYLASLAWPENLETAGSGQWTMTILNGWTASGDVAFEVAVNVEGVCTPLDDGIGCPGDLNADGMVNVTDLLALLGTMGCQWDCLSHDLNGDGMVNVSDVLGFLGSLGDDCP